jgi:hypothetical protein
MHSVLTIPTALLGPSTGPRRRAATLATKLVDPAHRPECVPALSLDPSLIVVLDGSPRSDKMHANAVYPYYIGAALAERVAGAHDGWDAYLHVLDEPWGPLCFLTQDTYSFYRSAARLKRFLQSLGAFLDAYLALGSRFGSFEEVGEFRWCNGTLRNVIARTGHDVVRSWARSDDELRTLVVEAAAKIP